MEMADEHITEKELHRQISKILDAKGVVFIHSRTDKRTTNRKGTPDFLFSIRGHSFAWEVKTASGRLSLEQERMLDRMSNPPNQWNVAVIRSAGEATKKLYELGA